MGTVRRGPDYGSKQRGNCNSTAYSQGVLLPLLCVLFCEVQHCWTLPLDFVCNPAARKSMNIIGVLEEAVLQEKLSLVSGSMDTLLQALGSLQGRWLLPCQPTILQRLKHNVQNHQHILNQLNLPKTSTCSQCTLGPQDTGCKKQETHSLRTTLQLYNKLLRGPLELLLGEFSHNCTQDSSGYV